MASTTMRRSRYQGVYTDGKNYYTPTDDPEPVYGEKIVREGKKLYRRWDPARSKLAAAMYLGLENFKFKDSAILYLGAATGTTVSHISDISHIVWAVEISPISMESLVSLAERRRNIIPILNDARKPEEYSIFVDSPHVIYQDISQRDQVEIFLKNMEHYEPEIGYLMLKTRTINVRKKPREILKATTKLIGEKFTIKEIIDLKRFQKDHYAIVVGR